MHRKPTKTGPPGNRKFRFRTSDADRMDRRPGNRFAFLARVDPSEGRGVHESLYGTGENGSQAVSENFWTAGDGDTDRWPRFVLIRRTDKTKLDARPFN